MLRLRDRLVTWRIALMLALPAAMLAPTSVVADGRLDFSPPNGSPVLQVDAGVYHYCAVRNDRTLICWRTVDTGYEGEADPPSGKFLTVSAGQGTTCAIRTNGRLACWGEGTERWQLKGRFTAIGAGLFGACAIRTNGRLACWGQLEDGSPINPPDGTFAVIASGGSDYYCAIRTEGSVACWGEVWLAEPGPPAGTFTSIAIIAWYRACGVRTDGTLACWGVVPPVPAGTYLAVDDPCSIRSDGTLDCWVLWEGDDLATPPTGTFRAVSGQCAIRTSGRLVCWAPHEQPDTATTPAIAVSATGLPYWLLIVGGILGAASTLLRHRRTSH